MHLVRSFGHVGRRPGEIQTLHYVQMIAEITSVFRICFKCFCLWKLFRILSRVLLIKSRKSFRNMFKWTYKCFQFIWNKLNLPKKITHHVVGSNIEKRNTYAMSLPLLNLIFLSSLSPNEIRSINFESQRLSLSLYSLWTHMLRHFQPHIIWWDNQHGTCINCCCV